MCMWSEKLNLLQRSQNIYVIVQNLYCFALVSLSILLRFSASSIPIMVAWEPLWVSVISSSNYQRLVVSSEVMCWQAKRDS